jgi:hypothetical protein
MEVRHPARLILQHADQQRRPPLLRPPLATKLPDRVRPGHVQRLATTGRPQQPLLLRHRRQDTAPARPRARNVRPMRALRPIPPPRLRCTRQDALEQLRLRPIQLAVRVQRRMDHRPKRRRPRRPHRVTPPTTIRPPFTPDDLHSPGHHRSSSSSPPRIRATTANVRSNAASSSFVCTCRYRALRERRFAGRSCNGICPATGGTTRLTTTPDDATGPPWVACDPRPAPLRPVRDPTAQSWSQIACFRCATVRSPAQAFYLHSANSRAPSLWTYRVEAAGIEPASAAAPTERLRA